MFDDRSIKNLTTLNPRLRAVIEKAEEVGKFQIIVTCGFRDEESQNRAYHVGLSNLKWPESKHNRMIEGAPYSDAVDLAFAPIDWHNINLWHYFAGFIIGVGYAMGEPLRWGGDWDGDNDLKDQKLNDYGHFELINP